MPEPRGMSDRPGTAGAGLSRLEAERIIAILDDTVEKLGFLDRFVTVVDTITFTSLMIHSDMI